MVVPSSDQYFLGRLDMSDGVGDQLFEKQTGMNLRALNPFPGLFSRRFLPVGFAQMVMLDKDFQKNNYDFKFVRQEPWRSACRIVIGRAAQGQRRRTLRRPDLG